MISKHVVAAEAKRRPGSIWMYSEPAFGPCRPHRTIPDQKGQVSGVNPILPSVEATRAPFRSGKDILEVLEPACS